MEDVVSSIDVYLVETPVKGNFSDSTRKVETIGYVVVDITTKQGVHGVGLTYHEVGGQAVKAMIDYDIAPNVIGRNPFETESIYSSNFAYFRSVGRKGLAFCAYSAVDIALWDIKGKILNMPLYRLLGGNRRDIPLYASGGWTSYTIDELVAESKEMVERGYKTIKIKVGIQGGKNINEDVRRIKAVREAVGPDIGIMIDANNAFTAATAIQFAGLIRECNLTLFEEPVFADDIPGLARFRQMADVPVGTGEHEYTRFGVRDLLLNGAADYVQMDVTRCGGYTEALKVLALTQAWNVFYAPHGMDIMHMHLVSPYTNCIFLERLFMFESLTRMVFINPPEPHDGMITIPEKPGLGLDLNYDILKASLK
jgi:L-alanine-DL-glutamate epimerase-like enolase superfamily enzyme